MSKEFNELLEQMQRLLGEQNEDNAFEAADPNNPDPLNLGENGGQNGQEPDGEQPRNAIGAVIENLVRFLQNKEQESQEHIQRELLRAIMARCPRTAEEFFDVLRAFIQAQRRRQTRRGSNAGLSRKFWRGGRGGRGGKGGRGGYGSGRGITLTFH